MLVIVGLLAGGVMVGRDMINAASERAQLSQLEKIQSAVYTFRSKYNNYLPGDIPDPEATNFGLVPRGTSPAMGDGNGVIQGTCGPGCIAGFSPFLGEAGTFWVDLTTTKLIEGSFTSITPTTIQAYTPVSLLGTYLPAAKINTGNYLYIWNGGPTGGYQNAGDGKNYIGLSMPINPSIAYPYALDGWKLHSNPGLTVRQAYDIDKKIDDGLPQSGKVMAWFIGYDLQNFAPVWAAGGGTQGTSLSNGPSQSATPASTTTCYDNNNVAGAMQAYSITQNNGSGVNCALSFQLQ